MSAEHKSSPSGVFSPGTVLVTGGAGFIGSNLVRWLLSQNPALKVITLDALTYAGNRDSLADVDQRHGVTGDRRFHFVHGDIRDPVVVAALLNGTFNDAAGGVLPRPDAMLHLAAESHVDRSITGPASFISTNVQGTLNLLELTRRELAERPREFRFVNVSTDEVYGSLGADDAAFTETHSILPNSPYSASKASADCLVRAYRETFSLPCLTTRCSNNYGPYQFPEKLIPLMISRAIASEPLPVYGDGLNIRDWLHVEDHCSAIWRVCTHGVLGEIYNIGGLAERRNIDIVKQLLKLLGRPESLIKYVADRAGHDRRYAIDNRKIQRDLHWQPAHVFESGLASTVEWYLANRAWWENILSRAKLPGA